MSCIKKLADSEPLPSKGTPKIREMSADELADKLKKELGIDVTKLSVQSFI